MSSSKKQMLPSIPLTRVATDPVPSSRARSSTSQTNSIKQMLLDFWNGNKRNKHINISDKNSSSENPNLSAIPKHLQVSPTEIRFSSLDIARNDNNISSGNISTDDHRRSDSTDQDDTSASIFTYPSPLHEPDGALNKFLLRDRSKPTQPSLARIWSHQKRFSADLDTLSAQTPYVSSMSMFGSSSVSAIASTLTPSPTLSPSRLDQINRREEEDQKDLGIISTTETSNSCGSKLVSIDSGKSLDADCLPSPSTEAEVVPTVACTEKSEKASDIPKILVTETLNVNAEQLEDIEAAIQDALSSPVTPTDSSKDLPSPASAVKSDSQDEIVVASEPREEIAAEDLCDVNVDRKDASPDAFETDSTAPTVVEESSVSEVEYEGKKVRFAKPLVTLAVEPEDPDDPKFQVKKKKKKNPIKRAFKSAKRQKSKSASSASSSSSASVGSPKTWWKSISGGNTLPRRPDSLLCTSNSIASTSPPSPSPSTSPPSLGLLDCSNTSNNNDSKRNSGLFGYLHATLSSSPPSLSSSPFSAVSDGAVTDDDVLRTVDEKVMKGKHAGLFTLGATFGRSV